MVTLTFWLALIAVIWAARASAPLVNRALDDLEAWLMFSEDVQERITK